MLRRFISDFSKLQSFLSKETWVVELLRNDNLGFAISRAKSLGTGESYIGERGINRLMAII